MADQSEPYDTPPVVPSIPRDHLEPPGRAVDRKLQHVDTILTQLDLSLAVIARLLEALKTQGITLDGFRTDNGPRAKIVRKDSSYEVSMRCTGS
jgi:hypothetical protein